MTVDQRRRLQLYEVARDRLGSDAADTLMELLPPMDSSELVTKGDLAVTSAELRAETAAVRTEMAELRTDLRTEMAELRTEMHDLFREQTNRILFFVIPTMLSGVGLAFAAARL